MLDPLGALAELIVGFHRTGKAQAWAKLGASVVGTAFISFWGTWGTSIWALHNQTGSVGALVLGFANACLVMAVMVAILWKRSPLTRDLPLVIPAKVAAKVIEAGGEASGGAEYSEGARK